MMRTLTLTACMAAMIALATPAFADGPTTLVCAFESNGDLHALTYYVLGPSERETWPASVTDWRIVQGEGGWEAERVASAAGDLHRSIITLGPTGAASQYDAGSIVDSMGGDSENCPSPWQWRLWTAAVKAPSGETLLVSAAGDTVPRVDVGWPGTGVKDAGALTCAVESGGDIYVVIGPVSRGYLDQSWRVTPDHTADASGWDVSPAAPPVERMGECFALGIGTGTAMAELTGHPAAVGARVTATVDGPPMVEALTEPVVDTDAHVCLERDHVRNAIRATVDDAAWLITQDPFGWGVEYGGEGDCHSDRHSASMGPVTVTAMFPGPPRVEYFGVEITPGEPVACQLRDGPPDSMWHTDILYQQAIEVTGTVRDVGPAPLWISPEPHYARPDMRANIGLVWEEGAPYALTVDDGVNITVWNVTDGMSPVPTHNHTINDAEWSTGHFHVHIDGIKHGVVAVVGGPPELVNIDGMEIDWSPIGDRIGTTLHVSGDAEMSVRQIVRNTTTGEYPEYTFLGPGAPSATGIAAHDWRPGRTSGWVDVAGVVSVGWQPHALVETTSGIPVLVDAVTAAALGLPDPAAPGFAKGVMSLWDDAGGVHWSGVDPDWHWTERLYLWWSPYEPRMDVIPVDAVPVRILDGGCARTYAAVGEHGSLQIYDISNPLEPRMVEPVGEGDIPWLHDEGAVLDSGVGVAHVELRNPERAAYQIPNHFRVVDELPRLDASGTWAVAALRGGGLAISEIHSGATVEVARNGTVVWAAERGSGWDDVVDTRAYDITNPESYSQASPYGAPGVAEAGEPGRAVAVDVDNATYALASVREDPTTPVLNITNLRASHDGWDRISVIYEVTNLHHEPLEVWVDRAVVGDPYPSTLILEQSHPYSTFESPGLGSARISGNTAGGYFGPSAAEFGEDVPHTKYGYESFHRDVRILYSSEAYGRVFAYVQMQDSVHLDPGETKEVGIRITAPCVQNEPSIETPESCGLGGAALITRNISMSHVGLALVAGGFPEQVAVAGNGDYSEDGNFANQYSEGWYGNMDRLKLLP